MRFSVIMPSRMIPYHNQASDPEMKLTRAITSVMAQRFDDYELIVIADGCERTVEIAGEFKDVKVIKVVHKVLFDNVPRNAGIDAAKGDFIIYCDADDYWGPNHLQKIHDQLDHYEWVWYNDIIFDNRSGDWIERACNIKSIGQCGTSNICHSVKLKWQRPGYAHDYYFIQQLLKNRSHTKIKTPEYYVCHIPGRYDL